MSATENGIGDRGGVPVLILRVDSFQSDGRVEISSGGNYGGIMFVELHGPVDKKESSAPIVFKDTHVSGGELILDIDPNVKLGTVRENDVSEATVIVRASPSQLSHLRKGTRFHDVQYEPARPLPNWAYHLDPSPIGSRIRWHDGHADGEPEWDASGRED